jgi:anti-sigma B factor antagonist
LQLPDQIGQTLTGVIVHLDGTAVYALDGEIDLSCADALLIRTLEVADATEGELVLDMAGVRYIDSTGVSALIRLARVLGGVGQPLQLTRVTPDVRDLLLMLELAEFFDLVDSSEEAVP